VVRDRGRPNWAFNAIPNLMICTTHTGLQLGPAMNYCKQNLTTSLVPPAFSQEREDYKREVATLNGSHHLKGEEGGSVHRWLYSLNGDHYIYIYIYMYIYISPILETDHTRLGKKTSCVQSMPVFDPPGIVVHNGVGGSHKGLVHWTQLHVDHRYPSQLQPCCGITHLTV